MDYCVPMTNNENLMTDLTDFPVTALLDALDEIAEQERDYSPVPTEYQNVAWIDISRECQEWEQEYHAVQADAEAQWGNFFAN